MNQGIYDVMFPLHPALLLMQQVFVYQTTFLLTQCCRRDPPIFTLSFIIHLCCSVS